MQAVPNPECTGTAAVLRLDPIVDESNADAAALNAPSSMQAEREWYEQDEGGTVDETHDPFVGDDKLFDKRAAEMQKKLVGVAGKVILCMPGFIHVRRCDFH